MINKKNNSRQNQMQYNKNKNKKINQNNIIHNNVTPIKIVLLQVRRIIVGLKRYKLRNNKVQNLIILIMCLIWLYLNCKRIIIIIHIEICGRRLFPVVTLHLIIQENRWEYKHVLMMSYH